VVGIKSMAVRGVYQLKEVLFRYCDIGGSSRGIREYIQTTLIPFSESNPQINFKVAIKRNRHPCITASYGKLT